MDYWLALQTIIKRSARNLSAASSLGLIGRLLAAYRLTRDGGIRSLLVDIITLLGCFNIGTREVKEMILFLHRERDTLQPLERINLLHAVAKMAAVDAPKSFFDFSGNDSVRTSCTATSFALVWTAVLSSF